MLLYKFEVEQMLLAAGNSRWLPLATREAEAVIERLKTATLSMTVASSALASEWGLPPETRLRELGTAAEGAWHGIFGAHLDTLRSLIQEIRSIRVSNDRLLRSALRTTQDTFEAAADAPAVYTPDGSRGLAPARSRLVDASL